MVCIYCSGSTQVTNSRQQKRANMVWRRRQCTACGAVFTTLEQADLASTLLVRYGSTHTEPFVRDNLFVSIYDSCKHRKSPLSDATALTVTATRRILEANDHGVVDRVVIVAIVAGILDNFDVAAATMYCAYHPIK